MGHCKAVILDGPAAMGGITVCNSPRLRVVPCDWQATGLAGDEPRDRPVIDLRGDHRDIPPG